MPLKDPLKAGTILNNRYRIVQLMGRGGFGAVYRAWDQTLNRPCALKENQETSTQAIRQFSQEAILLANLNHPCLPRVIDHFSLPEQGQYLVMDFVEGEDLRDKLERSFEPLVEREVVPWIIQICDAVVYLHSQPQPVIHRDIKPSNIRITPQGRAILVDFGIAKVFDPRTPTSTAAKAVTAGYSPPEQYGQGKTDVRSDIYALGATLYTLLAGQRLPDSVDILTGVAPPLTPARSVNPKISTGVSAAIEKAMALDRNFRYPSVTEFRADLIDALERKPAGMFLRLPRPVWIAAAIIIVLVAWIAIGRACEPGQPIAIDLGTLGVAPMETAEYLHTASPWSGVEKTPQPGVSTGAYQTALAKTNLPQIPGESLTPIPTEAFLIYVREGPGTTYSIVSALRNETKFDVIGRNIEGEWLYIRLDSSLEGWVFASVLKYYTPYNGNIPDLPVHLAPGTPTRAPADTPTN
jgi:serine/threonine protein kinase